MSLDATVTPPWAKRRMGRLAATTMITNTNMGSVKLRDSRYSSARPVPPNTAMKATRTIAQKPKTISTSPSRCHTPAWFGCRCARPSKNLVENV